MGSMVYSLLWVMQDFDHQQYGLGFRVLQALSLFSGLGSRVPH